ncbi:MAG: hypothetical protein Q8N60_00140 [Candidatus Diapherotrites archaeon]|nr:hypothetical protein [Candidatus Diapherotrites archaeon]
MDYNIAMDGKAIVQVFLKRLKERLPLMLALLFIAFFLFLSTILIMGPVSPALALLGFLMNLAGLLLAFVIFPILATPFYANYALTLLLWLIAEFFYFYYIAGLLLKLDKMTKKHVSQTPGSEKKVKMPLSFIIILILIACIFVLPIISPGPRYTNITCSSSDPAKIIIKAYNLSPDISEVHLQNVTGGPITINGTTVKGDFANVTTNPGIDGQALSGGGTLIAKITCEKCNTKGNSIEGKFEIAYTDESGNNKSVTVTCQGAS